MNIIVQNFITHLRTKQPDITGKDPKCWDVNDLESFAFGIQYIYKYLDEKDRNEKAELREYYAKLCKLVNESRKGVINSGFLNHIDRIKKAGEELPL